MSGRRAVDATVYIEFTDEPDAWVDAINAAIKVAVEVATDGRATVHEIDYNDGILP